ncbi:AAEL000915-PA [Aedes aegypti]|uniref:AAEL000915-PA n=1 Tax=Aedes aegypti TaxID=7159 RepID=Q17MY3_AEDAE|nr:AAEL000915-PA [Aedes aegypti]
MTTFLSLVVWVILLIESIPKIGATLCASCSSADDPKCSAANFTESTKECFNVNPCAVAIITGTGHTFRGCSSDPECYSNDLCDTCDGDGCNSGAFPPDRMSCLTCSSGCELVTSDHQLSSACVLHFQDEACVTVFQDFKPLLRGCLGDMDAGVKSLCDSGSADCVLCRENDCNVVNVRQDEQCLQCDSQDRGCNDASHKASACEKTSGGKCYSRLLSEFRCKSCHSANTAACVRDPYTVLDKKCPTNDTACATVLLSATGHLYRGCSTDAECVAEGDACIKCDEYRNCNFYRYPENRLDCYVCETSANPNCATLPYNRQFEKACLRNVSGDDCVTIFDDFRVIRRECRSGLSDTDLLKCNTEGGKECVACSGTGCNKITVRQDDNCLQCSTTDGLNCASGQRVSTICKLSSDGVCYNRLDQNGTLHRGCLSDLNEDLQQTCLNPSNQSCEICSGSGCNNNTFPANALQCVQCDSLMNMDCVQNQSSNLFVNPCRKHVNGDKCYTWLRTDGSIERGCQSSLNATCNALLNATCSACEGPVCNAEVYPWGRRSCYQCDGRSDRTCGLEQTIQQESKVCQRYQPQDQCYTLLQNGIVKRGCTSEFDADVCHGLERTECRTCSVDHCNNLSEVGLRSAGRTVQISSVLLSIGILFEILNAQ